VLLVCPTGGLGCGEWSAGSAFEAVGVPIIGAEQIAHSLTQGSGKALDAIRDYWGGEFVSDNGELNRDLLRERVFASPHDLAQLESILHPLVIEQIQQGVSDLQNQDNPPAYCVVVIPLMVEKDLMNLVDKIVVIDVPEETQILRAGQRDGKPLESIKRIMNQQASRESRQAVADFIIDNAGTETELITRMQHLHNGLIALTSS